MQNYFGPFYFGELKRYNSKYCSNFGLQLIFVRFSFAVLFFSRNKGHANIKGCTVYYFADAVTVVGLIWCHFLDCVQGEIALPHPRFNVDFPVIMYEINEHSTNRL